MYKPIPFFLKPFYYRNLDGQMRMEPWLANSLFVVFLIAMIVVGFGLFINANNTEMIITVQGSDKPNQQLVEDLCAFEADEVENDEVFRQSYLVQVGSQEEPHYVLIWGGRFGPEIPEEHNFSASSQYLNLAQQEAGPIHYGEVRQVGDGVREVYCRSDYTWDSTFLD